MTKSRVVRCEGERMTRERMYDSLSYLVGCALGCLEG